MTRDVPVYPGDFAHRGLPPAIIAAMTDIAFGRKEDLLDPAGPVPVDTIFIFNNAYGYPAQARSLKKLFRAAGAPPGKLILTGGMPWKIYPEQEPDLQQAQSVTLFRALARDIPPATRVHLETRSVNTRENADLGWQALTEIGGPGKAIAVAAFNFHMGRSQRTLRATGLRHGWDGALRLWPYKAAMGDPVGKGTVIDRDNWMKFPAGRARILGELKRIRLYGARGDIHLEADDPATLDWVLGALRPL